MSPHSSPERVFSGRIKDRTRETAEIEPSCSLPYIDIISRDRKKWFQTTCDTISRQLLMHHLAIGVASQLRNFQIWVCSCFWSSSQFSLSLFHSLGCQIDTKYHDEALSLYLIQWPQCQACRVQSCCQYVFFFSQNLSRGIQFGRASINGALKKTVKFCVTLQNLHFDHIWV